MLSSSLNIENYIYNELIDDICLELSFEIHKKLKSDSIYFNSNLW